MANPEDVRLTKMARSELGKHGFELTHTDLRVTFGVLYIKGTVSAMRGATFKDAKAELELVSRVMRQRAGIKDVVIDVRYRT